jgi:hypothetical protein
VKGQSLTVSLIDCEWAEMPSPLNITQDGHGTERFTQNGHSQQSVQSCNHSYAFYVSDWSDLS